MSGGGGGGGGGGGRRRRYTRAPLVSPGELEATGSTITSGSIPGGTSPLEIVSAVLVLLADAALSTGPLASVPSGACEGRPPSTRRAAGIIAFNWLFSPRSLPAPQLLLCSPLHWHYWRVASGGHLLRDSFSAPSAAPEGGSAATATAVAAAVARKHLLQSMHITLLAAVSEPETHKERA